MTRTASTLSTGSPAARQYSASTFCKHGEDPGVGQFLVQYAREMSRGEVRFAEQHEDHGVGMALADLGNLGGGVTVAGSDLAQVFARHAIETIDGLARDREP